MEGVSLSNNIFRIPNPEDIIASIKVEDSKMVKNTYEKMPVHRLITPNGIFNLGDFMEEKFKAYNINNLSL